ncbi:CPBP family intramembrane glutamic endopeptidase [Nakamurella sp. GG22]
MSPSAAGPARQADRAGTRTHALAAYSLLAYGLSWAWLIPMAVAGSVVVQGSGEPSHFPALLGPMLAAVLVAWRTGDLPRLLRSMTMVRVPLRWWAFALSPVLVGCGVWALLAVVGTDLPQASGFAEMSGLPAALGVVAVTALVLLVNGFGEETGWRGFALPQLQRRHSPLAAMSIVAVLWAGWHLPMFFVVGNFRTFGAGTVVGWFLGLLAGSIVLGWLYNRSGGSVVLVAIWHAGFNMVSGTAAATGALAAVTTTAVMMLAAGLVAAEVISRRRGRPSVLGPR